MKGIEISEKFYNEYGAALLDGEFKDIKDKIAVGLFGSGSECFGFDDDTSRDHDFDAGFIIVLPSEAEVDEKRAFALERAYSKLPDEFMGLKRSKINPVGGNRRGVIRAERFFAEKVGRADGLIEGDEWFAIPESFLAEAVNGKVFFDGSGVFSGVRDYLSSYPKGVFLKKLAGNILLAGQAGQYNYARSLTRGNAEAQLCVYEFVDKAMNAAFLLGGVYRPYYKWAFKALSQVEGFSYLCKDAEYLLTTDNFGDNAKKKVSVIEDVCARIAEEVEKRGIIKSAGGELERLAYAVNDKIADPVLRNKSVLYGV